MPKGGEDLDFSFLYEVWWVITGHDDRGIVGFLREEIFAHPIHVLVEVFCVLYIVYLMRLKPFRPGQKPIADEPTEKEKLELIKSWKPERDGSEIVVPDEYDVPDEVIPVVNGRDGANVDLEGYGQCADFGAFDNLNMSTDPLVVKKSLDAIDTYGVGSCGPRGFYGTVQPHLVLEEQLRRLYGVDAAIIYSFQYSTTSSVIPAFATRGDILVVDKGVNMSILNGVTLSRSEVHWFEHNDLKSLEECLKMVADKQAKKKQLTRRWIITEGVFRNYGDVAPLKEIIALRNKYKFRLTVDDSYGMGVLGKTGLGTAEALLTPEERKAVDVYTGSLDTTLGSTGGFCCGATPIVDHQRLSSAGYCFSASLPPFAAVAAACALQLMTDEPKRSTQLRENVQKFRDIAVASAGKNYRVTDGSSVHSAIFHFTFPEDSRVSRRRQEAAMSAAVRTLAQKHKIAVVRPQYTKDEKYAPPASVRATVSAGLSTERVVEGARAIVEVISEAIRNA
eukprot:Hpha_TRINITY_DN11450_c0_g1::TRINITY_DN11450_c0_g1_i1::g.137476::m.137476/K00654/SPT; serine palmitoyltransferase